MPKLLGRIPLDGKANVEVYLTHTGVVLHYTEIQGFEHDVPLPAGKCAELGSMLLQAGQQHDEIKDILQNFEDIRKDLNRRENEYLEGWMDD